MAPDLDGNPVGWTTESVDGQKIRAFRIPAGAMLRIKMPDGRAFEITAPPGGLMFIAERDFDDIEAMNKALLSEPN